MIFLQLIYFATTILSIKSYILTIPHCILIWSLIVYSYFIWAFRNGLILITCNWYDQHQRLICVFGGSIYCSYLQSVVCSYLEVTLVVFQPWKIDKIIIHKITNFVEFLQDSSLKLRFYLITVATCNGGNTLSAIIEDTVV